MRGGGTWLVVALEKRGHSSTVRVREEAPVAPEGSGSSIYETLQEPRCRCGWNGVERDESVGERIRRRRPLLVQACSV